MNAPVRSDVTDVQETLTQQLEPNIIMSAPKISTIVTTLTPQTRSSNLHFSAQNSMEESGQNERKLLLSIISIQIFDAFRHVFFFL